MRSCGPRDMLLHFGGTSGLGGLHGTALLWPSVGQALRREDLYQLQTWLGFSTCTL